jgi:hypothetical protein
MRKLLSTLSGVAVVALATAGVARAAAAPPSVFPRDAISVTRTTALLRGVVNPHGMPTTYVFDYGPTTSYGTTTPAKVAPVRKGREPAAQYISGLTPGTVYHFVLIASDAAGVTTGRDLEFKTQGVAPSQVLTGPPSVVDDTAATVTGTINPAGAATTWVVQYGTTTGYGSQTFAQTLPAGTAPVPISAVLSGLAPETLFHYRIVSNHGAVASYGDDQTFFTRPASALAADMTTSVTPRTDGSAPYTFAVNGTLRGGTAIPAAQRCSGTVGIRYFHGAHQLGTAFVDVTPSCEFSGTTTFSKLYGSGRIKLRVSVFYRGNGYLAKESRTDHPLAGRRQG